MRAVAFGRHDQGLAQYWHLPLTARRQRLLSIMFSDDVKWIPRPQDVVLMNTEQLRDTFLLTELFGVGELRGVFTALDRLVVGGAMPIAPLELPNHPKTGRAFFLERRELGAINIGGPGVVHVDGKSFSIERLDCVYVPMGTRSVIFESTNAREPAQFYFLSCPAHATYPVATMKKKDATAAALGTQANANRRTIHRYIHEGGILSCQLVMGFTELAEGSVWNSFPPTPTTGARKSISTSIWARAFWCI